MTSLDPGRAPAAARSRRTRVEEHPRGRDFVGGNHGDVSAAGCSFRVCIVFIFRAGEKVKAEWKRKGGEIYKGTVSLVHT